jgi:hypothetical protein
MIIKKPRNASAPNGSVQSGNAADGGAGAAVRKLLISFALLATPSKL